MSRPVGSTQFGSERGAYILGQDKSDFILARMYLIYLKLIPKTQAHSWSQGLVVKLHIPL
jgi:hypothetical protein